MPTVNITETEINPTYVTEYGGGRRRITETEINPTWETDPLVPTSVGGLPNPLSLLIIED